VQGRVLFGNMHVYPTMIRPYTGIANRSLDPGKDEALHAACDTVGPQHNPQTIHAFNIGRGVAAVAEFLMVG